MVDHLTKKQRSKNMKSVKSSGSKLENSITKALWGKGFRFRKNVNNLFGKPDIAIKKYKIVIFIDSCFWHGCPTHSTIPHKNHDFWKRKINGNIKRDNEVTKYYKDKGWNILRIWEHDIKRNQNKSINEIIEFINKHKGEFDDKR
ncbi:very short patch repair endonuclease [Bacillus sp. Marseille-Q3570]|uniref:very short patch repair endonuclease n=1 Tax=Bacillus sp. Marseille-Q3570 TaxID=2963522 RepID=UPI0021B7D598|nr:very short patch repair endonuclease [Bacillus sp. Marseille-Q3570]